MFIGEIAAQAGVSVQAVRLYERRGLMRRATRSAANYRHYEPIDLDILKTIAQCHRLHACRDPRNPEFVLGAGPEDRAAAPQAQ